MCPAPLDMNSLHNGLLKYRHSQKLLVTEEFNYLLARLHATYGFAMRKCVPWSDDEVLKNINRDSTCGYPYNAEYDDKGDLLDSVSVSQLWEDFISNDVVVGCSLKDELRTAGKDSRVFLPAPAHAVVAGMKLFGAQNDALIGDPNTFAIAAKIQSPGPWLSGAWTHFSRGSIVTGDGNGHDAHFPIVFAMIILLFRKAYIPAEFHDAVDKYYSSIYTGWKNVFGVLVRLLGNSSGHFCTTVDNSLFTQMLFWLYEYRTSTQIERYKICGDDFIVGGKFNVKQFFEVCDSLGVSFDVIESDRIEDHSFLGTFPVLLSSGQYGYTYDSAKFLESLLWERCGFSQEDRASRAVSYAAICWSSPDFELLRDLALAEIRLLPLPQQPKHEAVLDPAFLSCLYNRWEASRFSRFVHDAEPIYQSVSLTGHVKCQPVKRTMQRKLKINRAPAQKQLTQAATAAVAAVAAVSEKKRKRRRNRVKKGGKIPLASPSGHFSHRAQMRPTSEGGVVVRHREYVAALRPTSAPWELIGNSGSAPGLDFNPGCPLLFPWLSSIAGNYEKFRFRSLKFELTTMCAATVTGCWTMAVDYDWDDAVAATKAEMLQNHTAVAFSAWESRTLVCDQKALNGDLPWRYTLNDGRFVNPEPRFAYSGFLMIGAENPAGVTMAADLWVEYEVEFAVQQTSRLATQFGTSGPAAPVTPGSSGGSMYVEALPRTFTLPTNAQLNVGVPGTAGIPAMTSSLGFAPSKVMSVKNAPPGLLMDIVTGFNGTVTSPNTLLSYNPKMVYEAFNSVGTSLGIKETAGTTGDTTVVAGPEEPTQGGTNGVFLNIAARALLGAISATLPIGVAYLAPYLKFNQPGAGLGTTNTRATMAIS